MYITFENTSYISGDFGKYDGIVKNYSARYARNSVSNYNRYLSDYTQPVVAFDYKKTDFSSKTGFKFLDKILSLFKDIKFNHQMKKLQKQISKLDESEKKRPPLQFIHKYMPGKINSENIDKIALMGAAYEELGGSEVSVSSLDKKLNSGLEYVSGIPRLSAEAMDLNHDKKIDIAEYAASILLEDALSTKNENDLNASINGIITNVGSNELLAFATDKNKEIAYRTYSGLYKDYNLGSAKAEFLADKNNVA